MTKALQKLAIVMSYFWRVQLPDRLSIKTLAPQTYSTAQWSGLNKCEGDASDESTILRSRSQPNRSMPSRYPLLKKWSSEEHELLKALAADGHRPDIIARKLERSEAAVRVRAWQHGIPLRLVTQKRNNRKP